MLTAGLTWRMAVLLGCALGVGYYAKTVMLPMAFVFLSIAAVIQYKRGDTLKPVFLSILIVGVIVAPFIIGLSIFRGRATFGDSGMLNYLVNVDQGQFFIPSETDRLHPVTRVPGPIEAYSYFAHVSGTYPLWYDPSYWHEGIKPHFRLALQLRTLGISLLACGVILFGAFLGLHITTAMLFLGLISLNVSAFFRRIWEYWILWIPALAGIAMYSVLIVEPRYLAAQFSILWIVAFAGLRFSRSASARRIVAGTAVVASVLSCALVIRDSWRTARNIGLEERDVATPECARAAKAIRADGVQAEDNIVIIGDWLFPSRQGAYIARLARVRIIGEARPTSFWSADENSRSDLLEHFARAGAKAVLTRNPPQLGMGWQRLADTQYYLYKIVGKTSAGGERHP